MYVLIFLKCLETLNVGTASSVSGTINVYHSANTYKSLFDYQKLEIYTISISSYIPLVQIHPSNVTPTGGWTTTKQIKIRELDAVESGVAKKILVICSVAYLIS